MASGFNLLSRKSQNRQEPVNKLGLITSQESQTRLQGTCPMSVVRPEKRHETCYMDGNDSVAFS